LLGKMPQAIALIHRGLPTALKPTIYDLGSAPGPGKPQEQKLQPNKIPVIFYKNSMHQLIEIFGEGKDLTLLQMSARGVVAFFLALFLIRLSGRRSFGMHMPLDNIISIILGAILSRAVVGASDFVPVIGVCTVIVLLHRIVAWLVAHHKKMSRLVQGEKILLFRDGNFISENMG